MENNITEENIAKGRALLSRLEQIQYNYFNGRPEWTNLELKNLNLFMAYVYFGYPDTTNVDENVNIDIFDLYKDEEKNQLTEMIQTIQKKYLKSTKSNNIEVGFTMIHRICSAKCNDCQNFPTQDIHTLYLLRIKLNCLEVIYIDFVYKRFYKNWNEYIKNNNLPKGYMFYPESGMYEEKNYLNIAPTPKSSKMNSILNFTDNLGKTISFSSGVAILALSFSTFPACASFIAGTAIASTVSSVYDTSRQIVALKDHHKHGQSLRSIEAMKCWLNGLISIVGGLTAPAAVLVNQLRLGKSLPSVLAKVEKILPAMYTGACVAQCSLEVARCALQIMDDGKVTLKNLISLRLDIFVVVGKLLPLGEIQNIIQQLATSVFLSPKIHRTIVNFGYCVSRYLMEGLCFIKEHMAIFAKRLTMYLRKQLTPDKLMCAWKTYREVVQKFQQRSDTLTGDDLIRHVIEQSVPLECDDRDAAVRVLCGPEMKGLLMGLRATGDRRAIAFYAERVMRKAFELAALRREVAADLLNRGKYDTADVDAEFCRQYELGGCGTEHYVLRGVQEAVVAAADLEREYREHAARPENVREELCVASHESGAHSLYTYTMQRPTGDLDANTCREFARVFDPRNGGEHDEFSYAKSEPGTAILYSISAFSVKLVLFSVDGCATSGRPPSLNISVFRDSRNSSGCTSLTW